MKAAHRFLVAALASLAAGGPGLAQTGHAAVAPGSAGGWKNHGPFLVCYDPNSSSGCVVETGVLVRAGGRVEVRARGRVNFGGGVSAGTAAAAASALLGAPAPPPFGRLGDAVRDPDGEPGTDPGSPAPGLRKNSLVVQVVQAATGILPKGARIGKFYQGGKSTSFSPGEAGAVVLVANDARPADNRAVCEGGLCGWEVTLDVYEEPATGPKPVAGPPPPPGTQTPSGPDTMATRTPVSGSQPPQVATLVTNPGTGSQPAQVPPLDTALGKAGTIVTSPGSGLPSQPPLAPAGGASHPDDVPGSKDHPLVPRARGAVARTYDVKKLDAYQLPLGPAVGSGFARSEKVRGRVTYLVYELAADCSVLEAAEQYEYSLRKHGFETVFACENADCGPDYGPNDGIRHRFWSQGYGQRQLTAVRRQGGGNVYASVHVQGESPTNGVAWVTVVESPGTSVPTGSQAPVSGIGASAGEAPGKVSPRSQPPASGIGAAAPPASGSAAAGSQAPASGIGAAAPQGSGSATAQQPPAGGMGAAGQGAQSPPSGIGAAAGSPPALTPEQRAALEQCVNGKLLGAAGLAGTSAATQAQEVRAACQRELQLTGAAR